jgi:membrane-associated phospholipid phosphatase
MLLIAQSALSQMADTISTALPGRPFYNQDISYSKNIFPAKAFIIPAAGITYGFIALHSNKLKSLDKEVRDEVWLEEPHGRTRADNYLQWSPAAVVYGLNAVGIHGKNNFRDRTMIYLLSQVFMNVSVFSLKYITHEQRPDGSDYYSFPSGHTANAFLGAEFMWQEYKDVSPWLALSGYAMAATTGYLRLYNNKHWFSDVIAGAGFGIASTKLAYWLYPKLQHKLFKEKLNKTAALPFYQNGALGISMVHQF